MGKSSIQRQQLLSVLIACAAGWLTTGSASYGQVVISQVYGGGGGSSPSASYKYDFIELFNRGTGTVTITGWSLQYGSATGNFGSSAANVKVLTGSIAPKSYYLVRAGSAGLYGAALPAADDSSATLNLAQTSGKIILVNVSPPLNTKTPDPALVLDLVGYGTADTFEGAAAGALSVSTAAVRLDSGMTDTDNNAADFAVRTPSPRNSASPPLPVQLSRFSASTPGDGRVYLSWTTLSETNNYGFSVERRKDGGTAFVELAGSFQPGHGTSLDRHDYSFTDATVTNGVYEYRLRQINLDGTFTYSGSVKVQVSMTGVAGNGGNVPGCALGENWPNPWNPVTTIGYTVGVHSSPFTVHGTDVKLTVYDLLGREVETLVNERQAPGRYTVRFDGSRLASGVYLYRLQAGNFVETKRMMLLK